MHQVSEAFDREMRDEISGVIDPDMEEKRGSESGLRTVREIVIGPMAISPHRRRVDCLDMSIKMERDRCGLGERRPPGQESGV